MTLLRFIHIFIGIIIFTQVSAQRFDLNSTCKQNFYSTSKRIDSINKLPDKIKGLVVKIVDENLKTYKSRLDFKGCLINNVDSLVKQQQKNSSRFLITIDPIIPKYSLVFGLKVPALEKPDICIKLDLDLYGQVLNFTWPIETSSYVDEIKDYTYLLLKVFEYAKGRNYKIENNYKSTFYFDKEMNRLIYEVSFKQGEKVIKKTKTEEKVEETYHDIIIDAETGIILSDNYRINYRGKHFLNVS